MTTGDFGQRALAHVRRVFKSYYNWRIGQLARTAERSTTAMVRPMVRPNVLFSQDTMYVSFKNIGSGTALNVESNISHPKFKFDGPLPEAILEIGQEIKLNISATDIESSQKGFELITRYQDIHDNWLYSKLTQDERGQHRLEYKEVEKEKKKDDSRSH